ncbi:rod-determining factor RdfA [Haloferax sp. Q22]|uniref:rod-determining factor RdfA n=1 Tax=Haloferax sp. (strain Q22) TaxID=1526048 RepID=UPI000737D648|nr:rod-determining factor RdfA [Haloferax sp. Q22]
MCKVDVAIERYGLAAPTGRYDSVDDYLLARWTGADGGESEGYKSLTTWFNKRLLARVYERNDRDVTEVRLEAEYEALVGDDDLDYGDVAADLATDDIDADEVTGAMASWSTMRRHLNECLDGEKPTVEASSDWERNSVDIARETARQKAESALSSLGKKGRLAGAEDAGVDVQVKVSCSECPTRVPLEDALDRGFVCQEHHVDTDEAAERTVRETGVAPDGGADSAGRLRSVLPIGALSSVTLAFGEFSGATLEFVATVGMA